MPRPYLNIATASYQQPVLSLSIDSLHLRGGGTISVYGFSQSLSFGTTCSYSYSGVQGWAYDATGLTSSIVATFSVGATSSLGAGVTSSGGHTTYNVSVSLPSLGASSSTFVLVV